MRDLDFRYAQAAYDRAEPDLEEDTEEELPYEETPWECRKCGQVNSSWAISCGRCEDD
jgi:hypothetical protein